MPLLLLGLTLGANMNGRYIVGSVDKVGVPFNDDYGSKGHEYFDVWAPEIATTYGENFWTDQGLHALPEHIVKRFAGKVMAITGYEQDQVMVDPVGQPGVNPDRDVSVPINWAYNHHYMAWMIGNYSQLQKLAKFDPHDTSNHGAPMRWVAIDKPSAALRADASMPTRLMFSEGNGGESRKSFHGYPNGYAQLIESPTEWQITPMQIDTRRRDCGVTRDDVDKCVEFEPWMEPKQARYGRPVAKSNYSGVLECPCNSRFGGDPIFYPDDKTKMPNAAFEGLPSGKCGAASMVGSAAACWEAASSLGLNHSRFVNKSVADKAQPRGCFVTPSADGSLSVSYNSIGEGECPAGEGASAIRRGQATSQVNVTLGLELDPTRANGAGLATITISGPANVWFAVGFNAAMMSDAPYTLVANGSGVFEQKIGTCGSEAEHCAGDLLSPSVQLLSNTVRDGRRTVVVSRPLAGVSRDHYTFDLPRLSTLRFLTAFGTSQTFAYHGAGHHHAAELTLLAPPGQPTCLCHHGVSEALCHTNGTGCWAFQKSCWPEWDGEPSHGGADLLAQRNPTCNSIQYAGGLTCCGHKRVLLDHDQDPGPSLLRYHMKFRFWFQEYQPGPVSRDRYEHRPGVLGGQDALPPAVLTTADALAKCTAQANCTGITFESDATRSSETPVKTWFKAGMLTDGAVGWHSWVQLRRPSHHHLPRFYQQTEANAGEYDIPPAFRRRGDPPIVGYPHLPISTKGDLHLTPGTTCTGACPDGDDCECEHTITMHWTMSNARMLYAGGHCHAPSCIDIRLYRNDTGTPELLCRQTSTYGEGAVRKDKFDEAGYIVLPPCLWGAADEGLAPPSWLGPKTPLFSIKRNRNTHAGHFGEMASWQMRGVNFPPDPEVISISR